MKLTKQETEDVKTVRDGITAWHTFTARCEDIARRRIFKKKHIDLADTFFGQQPYKMIRDGFMFRPTRVIWSDGIAVLGEDDENGTPLKYCFEDITQDPITLSDFMNALYGDQGDDL